MATLSPTLSSGTYVGIDLEVVPHHGFVDSKVVVKRQRARPQAIARRGLHISNVVIMLKIQYISLKSAP